MKLTTGLAITIFAALTTVSSTAVAQREGQGAMTDSAAVASVIAKYHEALAAGDSTGALALLSDDAVILESGGVETRAEYRSHHLPVTSVLRRRYAASVVPLSFASVATWRGHLRPAPRRAK